MKTFSKILCLLISLFAFNACQLDSTPYQMDMAVAAEAGETPVAGTVAGTAAGTEAGTEAGVTAGVEAGADGCAAQGKPPEAGHGSLYAFDSVRYLLLVAGELLP